MVPVFKEPETFDMHEFNILYDSNSALIITRQAKYYSSLTDVDKSYNGWVVYNSFRDVDILSNEVKFHWSTEDHIPLSESYEEPPNGWGAPDVKWDYIHMNSVDKDADGDYLISGRDTHTIYKVSGSDGSIIWRLGGKSSTFHLDSFNFSSQHDARFRDGNNTVTVISFFNNAANGTHNSTAAYSSAMVVALDTSPSAMVATVLKKWGRPDHGLTYIRGNVQILPNHNAFVCWSKDAYLSEFTTDGQCILEAKLTARGFASYRAYKFNFTGLPDSKPALKAFAFGTPCDSITTVAYVSWNGATEVVSWNFYSSTEPSKGFSLIGSASRAGFETIHVSAGYRPWIFAEAVNIDGRSLGNSSVEKAVIPSPWDSADCEVEPFSKPYASSSSLKEPGLFGDLRDLAARPAQQPIN